MTDEHHGRADEHDDRTRSTAPAGDEGSYVDAEVPDDATTTTEGPHDGEPDGGYTDSDIPSDR